MGEDPRIVDVAREPWDTNPGIPGARWKVLSRHAEGWPSVVLNWLPPELAGETPQRHYHRTVRERGLVIEGDLPMVEFEQGAAGPGVGVVFRAGIYMDRGPGCVHGLDPRRASRAGFTILEWRDGVGTYLLEDEAQDESVVEDAPAEVGVRQTSARPGVLIERDDLRLLDTVALPWLSSNDEPGVLVQELSCDVDVVYGRPGVDLRAADGYGYVLSGSVALECGAQVGAGEFLTSRGAAQRGVTGPVGCRVLRF